METINQQIRLGVNIDHIASLRQARRTRYPEPVEAARVAEQAGADSITVHLREDRRHIQERDVELLKATLQTRMNLEMAVTEAMIEFACRHRPEDCCLVPERREELTTEGGLDVLGQEQRIRDAVQRLSAAQVYVSLFVNADERQIEAAARVGAPAIEIHTGHYANASGVEQKSDYDRIVRCAQFGADLGLHVHAGHGLHYHNVQAIAAISVIRELNIGHAIIARAVFSGLAEAVREMKRIMLEARIYDIRRGD